MKRKTGRESGSVAYRKEGKQFRAILRIFFLLILASLHSFIASSGEKTLLFEVTGVNYRLQVGDIK